ncbi:MAG: rgpC [Ignavibacteria bacterium]|nr:rgpC [Ignavibacteria bacterium]
MISTNLSQKWQLTWFLAKTDFKLRYSNSLLGFLWSMLKPLAVFSILSFVFQNIFKLSASHFYLRILTGLLLFFFFSECTTFGLNSLLSKGHLLTKIDFPKWIIVLSSTINTMMTFSINILITIIFFLIAGVIPSIMAMANFLFFLILLLMISIGSVFILAPLFVKFRDISQIWEILILVIMYSAPIVYPLTAIPEQYHKYHFINPLTSIVYYTIEGIFENQYPPAYIYLFLTILFSTFFILSLLIFNSMSKKTPEYI